LEFPNWSEKDRYMFVFGEVVGVHIEDQYITENGLVDVDAMKPIGRLGYDDYTIVGGDSIFTMKRLAKVWIQWRANYNASICFR
jgi:hypothetical protein